LGGGRRFERFRVIIRQNYEKCSKSDIQIPRVMWLKIRPCRGNASGVGRIWPATLRQRKRMDEVCLKRALGILSGFKVSPTVNSVYRMRITCENPMNRKNFQSLQQFKGIDLNRCQTGNSLNAPREKMFSRTQRKFSQRRGREDATDRRFWRENPSGVGIHKRNDRGVSAGSGWGTQQAFTQKT